MISHYLPVDAYYSICGEPIDPRDHRAEPTCPRCQALIAEDDIRLAQFLADTATDDQPQEDR